MNQPGPLSHAVQLRKVYDPMAVSALYQGMALAVPYGYRKDWALAPVMARPARNASPEKILSSARTFFATTNTSMGRTLLQSERNATL